PLLTAYAATRVSARALLALPLLMALWVNLHGTFVLGLVIVALVCAGEMLRHLLQRPGALDRRHVGALVAGAAASGAAALLNPLGPGIAHYVATVVSDPAVRSLVAEWQPPSLRTYSGVCFFATLAALPLVWLLSRRRPTLTDGLLLGVLAALA